MVGTARNALDAVIAVAANSGDVNDAVRQLLAVTRERTVIVWAEQLCQKELSHHPDDQLLQRASQLLANALATPVYLTSVDHQHRII